MQLEPLEVLELLRGGRDAAPSFCVTHYAGKVSYDTSAFVEKNGDKVLADQRDAVLTSASPLVTALFEPTPTASMDGFQSTRNYVVLDVLDNVRS